jgi:alpha-galactosidase
MNRNYFVADPDAFSVSTQTVDDQSWHGGQRPLTLDEAQVSIALAAVSGGMFEIGDDLPTLTATPDRIALLKNADMLDMVRLGHASTPLDLMTYRSEDRQPSLFLLHEDSRQSILTVFNWTEKDSTHKISLSDLGLPASGSYSIHDVMSGSTIQLADSGVLELTQPKHSVRMLKIVDNSVSALPLKANVKVPEKAEAGVSVEFQAEAASDEPILHYNWDFGDGISLSGRDVHHAYTHEGKYHVTLTSTGLNGVKTDQSFSVTVTGVIATKFVPADKVRYRQ